MKTKVFLKSDFIQFFHEFIHVYTPEQELATPWRQNFDVKRNIYLVTSVICCKFQKQNLFEVLFDTFFS